MIIVDKALGKRSKDGNPIKVGLIGAGFMGRGIALQILTAFPGIRLVAIANRTISEAERIFRDAAVEGLEIVGTSCELDTAICNGRYAVTNNAMLLGRASGIDAIIESTGEIEFGAQVVMNAIAGGKHIILNNAELDATVGPILKVHADRAGVLISGVDGDEPAVAMNLIRYVRTIGFTPVLAGNLKGFYDPHRTPETQRGFAEKHRLKPEKATSFIDGTKLSMETVVLANAAGFRVGKRGMFGPRCVHVKDAPSLFPLERFQDGGLVDYLLGAEPGSGVFVIAHCDNPQKLKYLQYFKMGDGPNYVFYTPFHLPNFELPLTIARMVLFGDTAVSPKGSPMCEVIAVSKKGLTPGDTLDGLGGYTCYGMVENYDVCRKEGLLPMGLSGGCTMIEPVPADHAIRISDVKVPEDRLSVQLWAEQEAFFSPPSASNNNVGR